MARDPNRGANGRHGMHWIRDKKRAQIYARDGYLCVWCQKRKAECLDHLIPRILGGSNDATNLVSSCMSCNSAAGDTPRTHRQAAKALPYVELMGRVWV